MLDEGYFRKVKFAIWAHLLSRFGQVFVEHGTLRQRFGQVFVEHGTLRQSGKCWMRDTSGRLSSPYGRICYQDP
ncbi:hypothetical protein MA16_Dca003271 [Dendrobium catenatum]|uniref:Uncharacterized protein n=1 Tax=Dendrobium catenatum TaxID=906689 RepID=A0A2I0XC90_9ASPA|nr:hypothetical protein MA16_Dca003271 [Dendrobium catenatum]